MEIFDLEELENTEDLEESDLESEASSKTDRCLDIGGVKAGCSDTNCTLNGCVQYYPCS